MLPLVSKQVSLPPNTAMASPCVSPQRFCISSANFHLLLGTSTGTLHREPRIRPTVLLPRIPPPPHPVWLPPSSPTSAGLDLTCVLWWNFNSCLLLRSLIHAQQSALWRAFCSLVPKRGKNSGISCSLTLHQTDALRSAESCYARTHTRHATV